MQPVKRYYIHQFNYWWSLSPTQWRKLLEQIVLTKNTTYDLDEYKSLKHRPRQVDKDNYALHPYKAVCILDWELCEFKNALVDVLGESEYAS